MSEDLAARLREQGLRLTPQRQLILRAVEELRHATPDEVLAHVRNQVSSVNASTVYRTLEVLEELGLVRHTHLSDRAPTYHSTLEHEHVHVVCRTCHAVLSYDPDSEAAVLVHETNPVDGALVTFLVQDIVLVYLIFVPLRVVWMCVHR